MKEPKKLKCRSCESNEDLHELEHPASWKYILCGKCVEFRNKGYKNLKVEVKGNELKVDVDVKLNQYCTCINEHPAQCIVHGTIRD